MNFVVESEEELVAKLWEFLSDKIRAGLCVGLSGDLGVGKTTLVKGIAKHMGVEEMVSSPTFMISKRYKAADQNSPILQHIDLYRLKGASKNDIGEIVDMVNDINCVTFVEWPELIEEVLGQMDFLIKIKAGGENSREVVIDEN